jgi:replicative DNA helicase
MRVAPHSIEAEESVIGAMMISAEASDIALERLEADDYHRPAHQSIFTAMSELFNPSQPIDTVTVTEALRRSGALERVGGIAFLTALSDATFTASNIDHYVEIVDEHALRRRLLRAGGEIGTLATAVDRNITDVLDTAEQTVFGVSDRRVGDGLALIDPLLFPAIEKAEELSQRGSEVTGVPTGFRDLDRMLAGLHPTNLLIVAARPGMGKTALALSIAKNVAVKGEPVAISCWRLSWLPGEFMSWR